MFVTNALVLGGGLLMATIGVDARAIDKRSFMPHIQFTTPASVSTSTLDVLPPSPQPTCAFSPHLPLRTTVSAFSIPESAWPLLRTLLSTHILPPSATESSSSPESPPSDQSSSLFVSNSVQTLYFRSFTKDTALEGLVLGLVFSTGESISSDKELRRSLPATASDGERRSCIEEAIRKVESERVMEGVLELDGKGGTVGFLVYRVD